MEHGVSRYPLFSHPWLDRERKRFLAFARNDNMGGKKAVFLFETLILSRFPRTLSGSLCSPPSPRGEGYGSGHLLPLEGGAPKGRRLAPQRYERECERVRFPVSSSRAEPRDLFRLRVSFFLCESVCMKHRSVQFIWSMAFPVIRCSRILGLTANGKDFSLSLEMTIWGKRYSPFSSLVPSHQFLVTSRWPRIPLASSVIIET